MSGAGNVNGDDYDDVIVGVPKYDNGQTREGAAYIFHGSSGGIIGTAATLLESNQDRAYFGHSVSGAGDVNGDGYDDVIVGSLWYDNGQSDEGMAFVYHGSITGISTNVSTQLEANQDNAEFGNSVSDAGDVNGDGYDDVIVGAHLYDNGQNDEGVAFVYEGTSHGINPTAMTLLERNQEAAQFGESVSGVGDFNGDTYGDLIVGAYLYISGETAEGASFVYYGSIDGIETTVGSQQEADQDSAQFGHSVSGAGDVNGDGYDDVIVGANLYGQNNEGVAFVYYGLNNAPMASSVNITDINGYSAVVGDTLTGDYTYEDVESDVEGISTFRWFANGGVISDAIISSYTLEPDDSGKIITFEVIPVAVTGTMTGNAVRSGGLTVNNIPVAVEDSHYSVNEGASLSGTSVLTNDSDVDGDNLTAIKVSDPNYGHLTLESDGSFTYVHDGSETTFDFFMYSANDEFSSSNTVTVSITIIPQNDAPVADEQSLFIDQDNNVSFTLSGSDADGDIIEYIVVTQPVNGVLSGILPNLTYTPNAFYVGSDTFTFKVNDGVLDSTIVTVNFTVNDVNHPPEAVDDQISLMPTGEGILIDVLANDSDMDGDKLTVISVSVIYGTVTIQPDGILNYTPLIDNTVTDIISYTINDSHGGTAHGVVTIEILANASPVAVEDSHYSVNEGASLSGTSVLTNDSDVDGDNLTAIKVSDPNYGHLTLESDGSFTYVHDGSETTFDFFMYSANDEFSSSNTVTVSITIIPQNDAPVADEQSLFIDQDNNVSFTLSGSDADGDIIEYIVVTQPVNGVLSGILPNLTYTPNAFYVGSDTFTFKVNDGVLDSTIVTVNFTVNDVNHPPEAVDDQISLMPTGEGILIDVLANDSDMDGDKLTVISVSVIYGTVTIQPDGILNYTPLIDNTVTDIISYTINDSHGGTAHGVVTIEILANASPVLIDENSEMTQGGSVSLNLLDNDLDPEGGELTLISIDNDFVNFTADGDAKFTPDGSFFGTHTLYYTVQDNANNTAIGHWHIIVTETEAKREPEVKHESKGGASLYWGLFMLMVCFRRLSLTTRWCEYMKRNNCLRV